MRKVLRKLGFTDVDEASSGQQALTLMANRSYQLVLMDCQMPEMDGFETSRRIRGGEGGDNRNITIIAVTADAMKGAREKCLESGMNDYISKPVDISKLRSVLSHFLSEGASANHISVADTYHEEISTVSLPVLDQERLEFSLEGDAEERLAMIELFTSYAEDSIMTMESFCHDGDSEDWKKAAHRLKGSAANLGAMQLSNLCMEAEYSFSEAKIAKEALLGQIKDSYSEVRCLLVNV